MYENQVNNIVQSLESYDNWTNSYMTASLELL